jgi:hypothetical protein
MDGFFAYPSQPTELRAAIQEAARRVPGLTTWEENDIAGRFLVEPILENIENSEYLVADITRFNFNVSYEIGYAIGKCRRVFLVKSGALKSDDDLIREVVLFDTLGYSVYTHAGQLTEKLKDIQDIRRVSRS